MARIAVIGAGSWGTALAILLARHDEHRVRMWEFLPEQAERLNRERENREFLPGAILPESLAVTNDLHEAVDGAEGLVLVIPSQVTRSVLEKLDRSTFQGKILIGASKGIEQRTHLRMSQVADDVAGRDLSQDYVVLSGPSHAEEVAKSIPTTVVAASRNLDVAQQVQQWFSGPTFRVYAGTDVVGVELGAALKNIIALAVGICDGLGFGDNTRGAIITRGLHEISRLGVALGGDRETFAGLSGMGDLITTCTSRHSRNRFVGEQLGKGRTLDDILHNMTMVAEGVTTTRAALEVAHELHVEMPIAEKVREIMDDGVSPVEAVTQLMTRSLKVEHNL